MDKKLFLFDVDGTLLDHKYNEIPKSALLTIRHLRKEGHIVGVATGRNQSQLQKAINPNEFDFCIICNGGYLEIDGKKVYDVQFSQDEKNELCDLFDELNLEYGITTHHHLYAKNPMSKGVQRIVESYQVITPEEKTNLRDLNVYQFTVYEDDETRHKVKHIEENFNINLLGGFAYDIVNKDINKGIMFKEVVKIFNSDIKDTIAFGDSDNDIMLIQEAGIGIAMGNANDRVKDSADFITSESYNDGIYNAVKKLGYIL